MRVAALACLACAPLAFLACGSAEEATAPEGSSGAVLTGAGGATAATSTTTSAATTGSTTGVGGAGGGAAHELGPPYPIVLAHGFFGFDDFAGVDFVTYFYGVKDALTQQGELVYTPAVDPFNASAARGVELSAAIQQILDDTGYAKVNLIGHSQGGLDARVVAHDHPEWVASVTTIATPHHGTPVADVILGIVPDPNAQALIDWIVDTLGGPLFDQLGNDSSITTALRQFSQPGIAEFNAAYPDAPGVLYLSLSGRTALHGLDGDCQSDWSVGFVDQYDGELDTTDALFSVTEPLLAGSLLDPAANDGLVRAKDARWGSFLGCVPADHLDEVGQLLGDSPGLGNGFDHVKLYADLVDFLRQQGL